MVADEAEKGRKIRKKRGRRQKNDEVNSRKDNVNNAYIFDNSGH
jgi:hypothetical protein